MNNNSQRREQMNNWEPITGTDVDKCKYCEKIKYKRNFLKKYWCKLNNKLCGSVESNDCKYEELENDR